MINEIISQKILPHIKALFFDMDGVIYNSMPYHAKAWCDAFEFFDIDFTAELAYLNEGRTATSTVNLVFNEKFGRNATDNEIKQIYTKKSELFELMPRTQPIAGVRSLMERAVIEGFDIWVVTGSAQVRLLDGLVQEFAGLVKCDKIVSALDVKHGKPHPEPYLQALQKSGVEPHQAIVIENAPLGVKSGKAAGIFTIAVNTGILSDNVLHNSGADLVLKDMEQLFKIFWN